MAIEPSGSNAGVPTALPEDSTPGAALGCGRPERMRTRFAPGSYPAPKPGPGVFATSDSVATPARLPDGTPVQRSISEILPVRELSAAEAAPKGTDQR